MGSLPDMKEDASDGPQFRRNYVNDQEHGVPFLSSTDIMEADFTSLPLLQKKDAHSSKLAYLEIDPGMTLITCSGTVQNVLRAVMASIGFHRTC